MPVVEQDHAAFGERALQSIDGAHVGRDTLLQLEATDGERGDACGLGQRGAVVAGEHARRVQLSPDPKGRHIHSERKIYSEREVSFVQKICNSYIYAPSEGDTPESFRAAWASQQDLDGIILDGLRSVRAALANLQTRGEEVRS